MRQQRVSLRTWGTAPSLALHNLTPSQIHMIIRIFIGILALGSLLWIYLICSSLSLFTSPTAILNEGKLAMVEPQPMLATNTSDSGAQPIHKKKKILFDTSQSVELKEQENDAARPFSTLQESSCDGYHRNEKDRILIFKATAGQGFGNVMSGLLAVHLLAHDFGWTVCVHPDLTIFHTAFELASPETATRCARLFACEKPQLGNAFETQYIRLLNYSPPPNECKLKEALEIPPTDNILWIEANTYPRWCDVSDEVVFPRIYQAKPALLEALSWNTSLKQVVHLRAPDSNSDVRKGLDDPTLKALGERLPKETFLVTNKVAWYNWFAEHYGWLHPPWESVMHSALSITWGDREGRHVRRVHKSKPQEELRNLQNTADWYTLLNASAIIHTNSDFSSSAAHWMKNNNSLIVQGIGKDGNLLLVPEAWQRDEAALPLSQRQEGSTLPEKERLMHCDSKISLSGQIRSIVYGPAHRPPKLKQGAINKTNIKRAFDR